MEPTEDKVMLTIFKRNGEMTINYSPAKPRVTVDEAIAFLEKYRAEQTQTLI